MSFVQGYRTGHIYRDQATSYRGRSVSEMEMSQKKMSVTSDPRDLNMTSVIAVIILLLLYYTVRVEHLHDRLLTSQ